MKTKISPRDVELLSEYLDGRLNASKAAQLETRLKTNPELRSTLADLRQTRTLLRSLPPVKAPRSFKLKPGMVSQPAPRRIYPVFQFASAIAAILLVMVIAGDVLGLGLPRTNQVALPVAAYAPAAATQEASSSSLASGAAPESTPNALMAPKAALPSTLEPTGQALAAESTTGTQTDQGVLPQATAAPGLVVTEAPPPAADHFTYAAPITTTEPAARAQIAPEETPAPSRLGSSASPETGILSHSLYRIAEITLALLVLVTGLAALVLRRGAGA